MEMEMRKEKLHFLIIPYLAPGHILPSIDLGRLLASRGNLVTIITTPSYVARFGTAAENQQPIRFAAVPPRQEGRCESRVDAKTLEDLLSLFETSKEMKEPVKEWIEKEKMGVDGGIPMCMVSDYCQMWTRNLATELGMVRFVFNCIGGFPSLCEAILQESYGVAREEDASDNREMVITGIPDRVVVTKAQVPGIFPKGTTLYDEFLEAYETSDGIILNTFTELEPDYIHLYQTFKGKKMNVWPLGPVGLINKGITDKIHRGTNTSSLIMIDRLSTFLNSKPPDSIIYFCMGSLTRLSFSQVIEIGLGLEDSGHPFVWVIKSDDKLAEVESWLKESKFEERNKLNGFIIKGWAPQMMILSHPSVGGFLTHCGWNSLMEGITMGMPMLTWPCFFDQFLNERFLVNVLKIGFMTGVKKPTLWDEVSCFKSRDIKKSVKELMGCSKEAAMKRKRAKDLKGLAELAMEVGGSSQNNLDAFVHEAFSLVHRHFRV